MKVQKLLIPTFFLIAGMLLTGCQSLTGNAQAQATPTPIASTGVIAEGHLMPADYAALSFTLPGTVSEILVEEGDNVQAGDALASLGDTENLEAQVKAAELAVLDAQQKLTDLEDAASLVSDQAEVAWIEAQNALIAAEKAWDAVDTDDFQEKLDEAQIDVNEAEDDLEEAEEAFADVEDLDEDNATRQSAEDDLETAKQTYDEAVWALDSLENERDLAKAQLEMAQSMLEDAERQVEETQDDSVDPDDKTLAEANLAQAEAQLAAANAALSDATLTAPFDGTIVKVDLTLNAETAPGQPAFTLADFSQLYIETNDLTENEVVRIAADKTVTITFDALPGQTFTGQIESISDYSVEQFGDITYIARVLLNETNPQLRWGMTAELHFEE